MAESYNPDVLTCLANLSNDEVFTPPAVVNKMLDLLPQELFESPKTTFLDPAAKSGVFLREITKRLIVGLEKKIPDLQERVDHILHKQVFGIATTELTSLVSRRSLYCSKYPNCKYSVSKFDTVEGYIRFRALKHTFVNGRCKWCGASASQFDRDASLESHAYEFIHISNPQEIFNMKFDVVVSNPPYQMNVGNEGGNAAKAKAIYHWFIDAAIKLSPRYICMITPSRWMTKSSEGISVEWADKMLSCNNIKIMHDFLDATMCFPGVDIKGGVNYFLWEKGYCGLCNYNLHVKDSIDIRDDYLNTKNSGVLIRDSMAVSILDKIIKKEGEYYSDDKCNFTGLVSPKDFFTNKQLLTSSWQGYSSERGNKYRIKYYLNKSIHKKDFGWISLDDIPKNQTSVSLNKVYIPAAGGTGNDDQVLGRPFYGEPNSVCSQTYLVIGYDPEKHNLTENQCKNIITYIKTRFFRYLVSIKKKTQNGPRGVYQFVPLQDFSKPWSDEELYKKYKLTQDEIAFIESMIKPME